MTDKTKSLELAGDIAALLRARNPLLWIVTREEARVERYIIEAAASAGYAALCWDVGQGVTKPGEQPVRVGGQDPGDTLTAIKGAATSGNDRSVWIMRDLPAWLGGPAGATTMRQLRNLARFLPGTPTARAQAVIVLTPSGDVPPELAGHATVIEWPLPDRAEIAAILDAALNSLPDEIKAAAAPNGTRDAAIDAAVGLSGEEAQGCYARSLVQLRRIDPATVAKEKKRVVARERVLEWIDPLPGGLEAVGGLDVMKAWLVARKSAYTPAARAYGLPAPRGALLVGVQGCGKSMMAKAYATALGWPLLKLDMGALKSKFVGESEGNLRKAFKVIEAIGRCVVWLDEIEKALAGATQGASDGGVSADALGAVLTWMQERAGEAFVLATSNDVSALPPELLRKGRFDDVWFVDLPTLPERCEIVRAALRANNRQGASVQAEIVADACRGFIGAEIAALVPEALFAAFADGAREITTDDLIAAAAQVVPLSVTMAEKIGGLRRWAEGRARRATSVTQEPITGGGRVLDIA